MAASGLKLCPVHGRTPQSGEWLSDNNIIIILNVVIIIFHHHQIFVPSTNQPPKKPELHNDLGFFFKIEKCKNQEVAPENKNNNDQSSKKTDCVNEGTGRGETYM